jgi:uncharacterized protein YjaZ
VHVSDAVLTLARTQGIDVRTPLQRTVDAVEATLDSPPTTLDVDLDVSRVIPEVGEGGFTDPRTGAVHLWVAPTSPVGLRAELTTWLDLGAAHELNHSTRILNGPGYGTSLLETMVTEGVADEFARSIVTAAPVPPWDVALSKAQLSTYWKKAEPLLDRADLGLNRTWLFGGPGVPRWAAYSLGARLVGSARAAHPATDWKRLTREDARVVLSASAYG